MKAISTGNTYSIYDDSLKTYDALPSQVYSVRFSKMTGFFLEKHADIEISEDKIYGVHMNKVEKVLSSFSEFKRNLGVILSGDKGIGKSLFAKLLSIKAVERQLPVIIVDEYIPGIAAFIESIEQEAMFMFDEFDKTFSSKNVDEGVSPQAAMLTLFDGLSQGKKLFVVTCNEIRELNDYLINRPGRFHYHFRFEYPSPAEVREYLEDKLDEKYYGSIDEVVSFSKKIDLNYDCLRAIAFELNTGETFSEAIKDLNIINVNSERYNVVLHYENGMTARAKDVRLDLFDDSGETETLYLYDNNHNNFVDVTFSTSDCVFDTKRMVNIVKAEDLVVDYSACDDDDKDIKALIDEAKKTNVVCLSISRKARRDIHYAV